MKTLTGVISTCIGIFTAFLVQQCLPPIGFLHGARWMLFPTIFCLASMVLPFPAMIGLAVYAGLLTDLMYLNNVDGHVEIALGWHIVFFVIFGCIGQGLKSSMQRGYWWTFVALSAVGTSAMLFLELVMIYVRREGFAYSSVAIWRVFAPGLLAALFASFLYLVVRPFAGLFPQRSALPRDY